MPASITGRPIRRSFRGRKVILVSLIGALFILFFLAAVKPDIFSGLPLPHKKRQITLGYVRGSRQRTYRIKQQLPGLMKTFKNKMHVHTYGLRDLGLGEPKHARVLVHKHKFWPWGDVRSSNRRWHHLRWSEEKDGHPAGANTLTQEKSIGRLTQRVRALSSARWVSQYGVVSVGYLYG